LQNSVLKPVQVLRCHHSQNHVYGHTFAALSNIGSRLVIIT
jgi:hypothetical protein